MNRKRKKAMKRNSNPFTPVREKKSGKKRSRRSQKSRKYRKLDMGCSVPSTVASTWPMMITTTSLASLSVPSGLPPTSNILSMPKPPAHRPPYKMWAIHHPKPVQLSSQYTQTGPKRRTGAASNRRRGTESVNFPRSEISNKMFQEISHAW